MNNPVEPALTDAGAMRDRLDQLVHRYGSTVRACAARMTNRPQDIEDLTQETFLHLLVAFPRFRGQSALTSWVIQVARNTCIDAFRRSVRERAHQASLDTEDGDLGGDPGEPEAGISIPDEVLEAAVLGCYLGHALATLSGEYRRILVLHLLYGLSNQEVADRLGATLDSVKAKLRRARTLLRAHLSEDKTCPRCKGLGAFHLDARGLR